LTSARRTACGGSVEAVAFLVGVVGLVLLQRSALIVGTTTLQHDHLYWGVPLYTFFAESVALHRLPLWNPFTHGGEPFHIPIFQLRLLDPPAVLVALAGHWLGSDPVTLYAWDRFVRGVVLGVGAYLVLRLWARHLLTRLSLIPIVLFSSVQWSLVRQMAVAEQFLLAPFILLFVLRIVYLRDDRWRNWLAAAFLFGLNFQSYFFTGTVILLAFLGAGLLLFRCTLLRRVWRRPGMVARLAATASVVVLMLLPSAVLLSDTARFIFPPRVVDYAYEDLGPNQGPSQYEPRGEIRTIRPLLFPYRLQFHLGTFSASNDFVQLLAPFGNEYARPAGRTWGKPSEAFMYVGMLPLAIALLGMVAGKNSLKPAWMLTLVSLGLLLLGPPGFLYALLYWVFPPLWFARNTHTLVMFFVLALLYFYVLGCNRILSPGLPTLPCDSPATGPLARRLPRPRAARLLSGLALTAGVAVTVLTLSRARYPFTFYTPLMLASVAVLAWWLRSDLGRRGLYWSILLGWSLPVALLSIRAHDRTSALFMGFFLALPILVWTSWMNRERPVARLGVGLVLAGVAAVLIHRLVLLLRGGPAGLGLNAGLVFSLLGALAGAVVLVLVTRDVLRGGPPVLSREGLAAGLALIAACDLVAYAGYLKPLAEGPRPESIPEATAAREMPFPWTRRVIVPTREPSSFEQTIRYQDVLARTPTAFSPFFASRPFLSPDPAAAIDALLQGDRASTFLMTRGYYDLVSSGVGGGALAEMFAIDRPLVQFRRDWVWLGRVEARRRLSDLARSGSGAAFGLDSIILERAPLGGVADLPGTGPETGSWHWLVRRYDYNSLDLEVEAPARGLLYWADGFDPHWRAWVDGKEVPVHRANLAFKAVFLPPGRHAVRFEYRPTLLLVTSLLFVGLGLVGAASAAWALATPARLQRFRPLARGQVSLTGSPAPR
jgi:hypothetical protein